MCACAYGARTKWMYPIPSRLMSSTKTPWPSTSRRSSLRGTLCPCHCFCGAWISTASGAIVVESVNSRSSTGKAGASAPCEPPSSLRLIACRLHGLEDVPVAGAAADVALQRLLDLVVARARVRTQQGGRAHQHPGRAIPALERVVIAERLLERCELAVFREPFDGLDLRPVGLYREEHAALHELAVDDHRAGAAVPGIAADVAAGQIEVVANEVDQQLADFDLTLVLDAVDGDGHRLRGCDRRHSAPLRRLAGSPHREYLRQLDPVFARSMYVRRRCQSSPADGFTHGVLGRRCRLHDDRNRVDTPECHAQRAVEARSCVGDAGSVRPERDRGEPVVLPGRDRELREELARADCSEVHAEEEVGRGDGALAVL